MKRKAKFFNSQTWSINLLTTPFVLLKWTKELSLFMLYFWITFYFLYIMRLRWWYFSSVDLSILLFSHHSQNVSNILVFTWQWFKCIILNLQIQQQNCLQNYHLNFHFIEILRDMECKKTATFYILQMLSFPSCRICWIFFNFIQLSALSQLIKFTLNSHRRSIQLMRNVFNVNAFLSVRSTCVW